MFLGVKIKQPKTLKKDGIMADEVVKKKSSNPMDFGSDDTMPFIMIIMLSVLLPMLTRTQVSTTSAQSITNYSGIADSRVLAANATIQWINLVGAPPYTPWIRATFQNDGPNAVYIGVNNPGPWKKLELGESYPVNYQAAGRVLETVFYKCDTGETASVRVDGTY